MANALRLCGAEGVPVVPQGGNTGLFGTGVLGELRGVILSLSRMNATSSPDWSGGNVLVEAEVILEQLHQSRERAGLMFPMYLGFEGSAQIGGLVSSKNAGE